jgi:hypothetical protein
MIELMDKAYILTGNIHKQEGVTEQIISMANDILQCLFNIHKIIEHPTPITPEQFRDIEGEDLPGHHAVYQLVEDESGFYTYKAYCWEACTYWEAKERAGLIVCAYNLKGPPARDWRPE